MTHSVNGLHHFGMRDDRSGWDRGSRERRPCVHPRRSSARHAEDPSAWAPRRAQLAPVSAVGDPHLGRKWYEISNAALPVVSLNGALIGQLEQDDRFDRVFREAAAWILDADEVRARLAGGLTNAVFETRVGRGFSPSG